jgi:DNA-binding CsgD family transcriptional regulator
MVLQGATNKEIAASSSISERTVKTHLYRIYKKLKVKSRTKAIALLSHS